MSKIVEYQLIRQLIDYRKIEIGGRDNIKSSRYTAKCCQWFFFFGVSILDTNETIIVIIYLANNFNFGWHFMLIDVEH